MRRSLLAFAFGLTLGTVARPAQADLPLSRLERALAQLPDGGRAFLRTLYPTKTSFIVRSKDERVEAGFIPIAGNWMVGSGAALPARFAASVDTDQVLLNPRRFPLLDRVVDTVHLPAAKTSTGLSGEGSIVGIVDTGVDVSHPALRSENGTTRIEWLLAFGRSARGVHADLEKAYGCDGDDPCAIYSADDLNEILESSVLATLPKDPIGHGTHIASLAAGRDSEYPGIAPGADLIVVAAADADGGVSDARILLGTKFAFDRATEAMKPAVVNVSLGSSFGAHDGTSSVERGLLALAQGPGRAVVVASGNSGHLRAGNGSYPGPLGVHTEVAVLDGGLIRVPILTPPSTAKTVSGSLFVWISWNREERLAVGFENDRGEKTTLIPSGQEGGIPSTELDDEDDYDVVILNGIEEGLDGDLQSGSAILAIAGSWESGRTFFVRLSGKTTADLWVTGQGDVGLFPSGTGPLFPRAVVRGTVAVPGSSPELITVGSTDNRSAWVDFTGTEVGLPTLVGHRSTFSAAGPNRNGSLKPELTAPGGGIIGAMAREADPRGGLDSVSQFAAHGACPSGVECFVVDDLHAVASGTSMAAPLVTGAIALLMQRDPTLTMSQIRQYLMAGAHSVPGEEVGSLVGTGELDLIGTLLAQERDLSSASAPAVPENCRVVWANSIAYPGARPPLRGFALIRDEEGIGTFPTTDDLTFQVEGPGTVSWTTPSVGLVEVSYLAPSDSAGQSVSITTSVQGTVVDVSSFVVERDPTLAAHGYQVIGGTCAVPRCPPRPAHPGVLGLLFAFSWVCRQRRLARH